MHIQAEIFCMSVMCSVTGINNYYHDYVSLLLLEHYIFYLEQSQVTCRYIIDIIMPSWALPHIRTAVVLGSYYLAF